ncbi:MAG: hypothetical protein AAF243_05820 [Cyanobacteria bacterium P01_A01_bin.137]
MSTKLEYVQQLEQQIATAQEQLGNLKTEKEEALLVAQHEEIENLEKYLDEANVNLKDISAAAEDAWHELKESVENLMNTITNSLKSLMGDSDKS